MNCVVCNIELTGRQKKYCSPQCANDNRGAMKCKKKVCKPTGDGLSDKLKQEYGNVRVYGV